MFKKYLSQIKCSKEYIRLLGGYRRDFFRYAKYSCIGWNRQSYSEGQLEGRIIANYHVIEKGLSMPDFRPCFGVPMLKKLIRLTGEGKQKYGWNCNVNYLTAMNVIEKYMQRHLEEGVSLSEHFSNEEIHYGRDLATDKVVKSGSESHEEKFYFSNSQSNFSDFARSRHSCRVFERDIPVDDEAIKRAVEIARFTPSVCNRQCWKVHAFSDGKDIEDLLAIQNGNRGFGHTIPLALVVTCDVNVFDGYHERNQAYVDGGLFSMSLMYALHQNELGAVPLCWLVNGKQDDMARNIAEIPENEVIIMMIGVGKPVEQFSAPASQRRDVEEIIRIKK